MIQGEYIVKAFNLHTMRSNTSQLWLQSGHWTSHVCVKGVPRVFPPWVDSNLVIKLGPPSQACHPLRGKLEKNNFVVHESAYHVYLYFPSSIEPGSVPLVPSCGCLRPSLQIWGRWWLQSGLPISPGWKSHFWSLIISPPAVHHPMICYDPGGLGVLCVRS